MTAEQPNTIDVDQTDNSLDAVIRAYRSLGVVAIRNFYSPLKISQLAREADALLAKYKAGEIDARRIAYRPTIGGGHTFERFDPVCDIAPACEAVSRDPRLLELVETLIGGKPFLLKDKLLYKLNGDKGYALHQDYPYYNLNESLKDRIATIAIAIDEISQADGGLTFILGCHNKVQPAPDDEPKDVDPAAIAGAAKWDAAVPLGSLIVFHTLAPHSSGANSSGTARRVLYLTYIEKQFGHLRDKYYEARIAEGDMERTKGVDQT